MKRRYWLAAAAILTPCWAMAQPSLVGQWVMPVPNNAQCSEFYDFKDNGEVNIRSGLERVSGRYEVLETLGLPQVNVLFIEDNQMPDCFGSNEDQTNQQTTHYLKWESDNHVRYCNDVLGQNCPVGLIRQ